MPYLFDARLPAPRTGKLLEATHLGVVFWMTIGSRRAQAFTERWAALCGLRRLGSSIGVSNSLAESSPLRDSRSSATGH